MSLEVTGVVIGMFCSDLHKSEPPYFITAYSVRMLNVRILREEHVRHFCFTKRYDYEYVMSCSAKTYFKNCKGWSKPLKYETE